MLKKRTIDFKVEIDTRLVDNKRDITIIDREYRPRINKNGHIIQEKWYKYHCNICTWDEGWIIEGHLLGDRKGGCSCCCGYTVAEGINDIPTTAPWLIPYFQGGHDEAKLYTCHGGGNPNNPKGYIKPICPICRRIKSKEMAISKIFNRQSIACSCNDNYSFPNKFAFNVLEQLNVDFIPEYNPDWIKPKAYDFYFELNNKKYILEMDGGLGHGKKDNPMSGQTKEESKAIDDYKDEQAKLHGVEVIRIDCDYKDANTKFGFIKQNILDNKKLNEVIDLSNIDWNKTFEFCMSSRVKEACDLWNSGIKIKKEIARLMKIGISAVETYLKDGAKLNWIIK